MVLFWGFMFFFIWVVFVSIMGLGWYLFGFTLGSILGFVWVRCWSHLYVLMSSILGFISNLFGSYLVSIWALIRFFMLVLFGFYVCII